MEYPINREEESNDQIQKRNSLVPLMKEMCPPKEQAYLKPGQQLTVSSHPVNCIVTFSRQSLEFKL